MDKQKAGQAIEDLLDELEIIDSDFQHFVPLGPLKFALYGHLSGIPLCCIIEFIRAHESRSGYGPMVDGVRLCPSCADKAGFTFSSSGEWEDRDE